MIWYVRIVCIHILYSNQIKNISYWNEKVKKKEINNSNHITSIKILYYFLGIGIYYEKKKIVVYEV